MAYTIRLLAFLFPKEKIDAAFEVKLGLLLPVVLLSIGCIWIFYGFLPITKLLATPSLILTIISSVWVLGWMAILWPMFRKGKLSSLPQLIPYLNFDNWLDNIFVKPVGVASSVSVKAEHQLNRALHAMVYLKFSTALMVAWFDKVVVDGIAHAGWQLARLTGNVARQSVSGKIQTYLWWTILAVIILLIWAS